MSVICLDLNNFKTANDRRGHHFGDLLLKEGAAILLATTRSGDIVARTGGDEFVIVLPEAGVEQARALVIRIEAAFAALSLFADVGVGVSAGVAGEERLSAELPELLRCADDRMYEAKRGVKASLVAHAPQRGGPA
jgi:diguanylate cyclase (GGDEF)-like protein